MRWTERQRAMLAEMGLRVWDPEDAPAVAPAASAGAPGPSAAVAGAQGPAGAASVTAAALATDPVALAGPRVAEPRPQGPVPEARVHDAGAGPADRVDVRGTDTALATLDWPGLEARVAACRACSLCAGRRGVAGNGHRQADWMVVGGAPEAADEAAGTPYAGRRGELLDNMLRPLGLARGGGDPVRQPWLTHAVKCRSPADRAPEPAEVASCAPLLRREVELVRPRIVLALGRQAALALLGRDEPLGRLRGEVHRLADAAVVVTHEPAVLLRQPQLKAEAWDDLCLALEAVRETPAR
jgi:DNA polymerase